MSPDGELAAVEAQVRGDSRRRRRRCRPSSGSAPTSSRRRSAGTDLSVFVTGETAENVDYRRRCRPLAAARLRLRARLELRAAHDRVPLARRAGEGDRAQPALGRRGLRPARARLPEGRRQRAASASRRSTSIEAWLPLFLFSVLFGLSMDYHVFLLSRIRERYTQTGDTSEAVAFGVAHDRARSSPARR